VQHLLFGDGRYGARRFTIMGQEIMRKWRLSVARIAAIDNQHLPFRTAECHRRRKSGIAATDDNGVKNWSHISFSVKLGSLFFACLRKLQAFLIRFPYRHK
jgi:hypothetical protein